MKISDLIKLALKNLKGRWAALAITGIAVSAFCLCFSGAILSAVQEEKAQPYELILSAEGNAKLTDNTVVEIKKLESVLSATPVLQFPVMVKAGPYVAQLTLTGIDSTYIDVVFKEGAAFPTDSVMPYIVLNEAAQKQFSEDKKDKSDNTGTGEGTEGEGNSSNTANVKVPEIDWMNTNFSVSLGEEGKAVTSKVCGILLKDEENKPEEQTPAAYISLNAAKDLLQKSGQATGNIVIWVRVENIGKAESVSKEIAALGFSVTNSTEELQSGWDAMMREMAFLIVIAVFCLVSAAIALTAWRRISMSEQREAWVAMQWIGLSEKNMHRLFAMQSVILSLFGVALGILVAECLPSFLTAGAAETSSFTLATPVEVVLIVAIICIGFEQLPLLIKRKNSYC